MGVGPRLRRVLGRRGGGRSSGLALAPKMAPRNSPQQSQLHVTAGESTGKIPRVYPLMYQGAC